MRESEWVLRGERCGKMMWRDLGDFEDLKMGDLKTEHLKGETSVYLPHDQLIPVLCAFLLN